MGDIQAKCAKQPPYKLLALDGGGIRGVLSLEILAEIESMLAETLHKQGKLSVEEKGRFVLGDYFDYIAGTSTGGIIATALALGMSVKQVQEFYHQNGKQMFASISLLDQLDQLAKYRSGPLADTLKACFGAHRTLGDQDLRTLLMLVMRNASTDSPWLVTNNPHAKYNDASRADCNLNLPLWQLVRASTAAPTFFAPEKITIGNRPFDFVDGGMTTYNSPGFQLFLMATSEPYNLRWQADEQSMLLVSVGTGLTPNLHGVEQPRGWNLNLLKKAKDKAAKGLEMVSGMTLGLMYAAQYEQDLLCRLFGKCLVGELLDREVGTLVDHNNHGPLEHKLFTYLRYDAELTRDGLDQLGLDHIDPATVQGLDSVERIAELEAIGRAVARTVSVNHFKGFV